MKAATTQLLREAEAGDSQALKHLFAVVYADLHRRAQVFFRSEGASHTLQPTALVHEAFLKMVDQRRANWQDRAHFCRVASLVMRRILVDHARRKNAVKRGDGITPMPINPEFGRLSPGRIEDVLLVDRILERLATADPIQAAIVELRFFGGLNVAEVAETLDMSKRAVEAEWTVLRAVLRQEMAGGAALVQAESGVS